jgi:hypothetical protein
MFRFEIFSAASVYLHVLGVERIVQTRETTEIRRGPPRKVVSVQEIYPTFRTFPRIWKTRIVGFEGAERAEREDFASAHFISR